MTALASCLICEAPAVLDGLGMCPVCATYGVLVDAFSEGIARRAGREVELQGVIARSVD